MRILCDQHVPPKYVQAFGEQSWVTVATIRSKLQADASDAEIVAFAAENDWIIFTNDTDFYQTREQHGLLVYDQIENPPAGDVIAALRNIDSAYESPVEVTETVPDGWI